MMKDILVQKLKMTFEGWAYSLKHSTLLATIFVYKKLEFDNIF